MQFEGLVNELTYRLSVYHSGIGLEVLDVPYRWSTRTDQYFGVANKHYTTPGLSFSLHYS